MLTLIVAAVDSIGRSDKKNLFMVSWQKQIKPYFGHMAVTFGEIGTILARIWSWTCDTFNHKIRRKWKGE